MALSITATFRCDLCPATCFVALEPVMVYPSRGDYATVTVDRWHFPEGWQVSNKGMMCWRHLQDSSPAIKEE